MVRNYQNADCMQFKNKFVVLFVIIFGTLSFPILTRGVAPGGEAANFAKYPSLKVAYISKLS